MNIVSKQVINTWMVHNSYYATIVLSVAGVRNICKNILHCLRFIICIIYSDNIAKISALFFFSTSSRSILPSHHDSLFSSRPTR